MNITRRFAFLGSAGFFATFPFLAKAAVRVPHVIVGKMADHLDDGWAGYWIIPWRGGVVEKIGAWDGQSYPVTLVDGNTYSDEDLVNWNDVERHTPIWTSWNGYDSFPWPGRRREQSGPVDMRTRRVARHYNYPIWGQQRPDAFEGISVPPLMRGDVA